LRSNEEPMELLSSSITKAGYKPGQDICHCARSGSQ